MIENIENVARVTPSVIQQTVQGFADMLKEACLVLEHYCEQEAPHSTDQIGLSL